VHLHAQAATGRAIQVVQNEVPGEMSPGRIHPSSVYDSSADGYTLMCRSRV
jgi:hypothetical protein